MGVLASILIFAGLTLFATAVNDYISDAVKMLVILVVSVALFVVGLIGKQKKHNPFFMSLAGCGIGAIFISIFLILILLIQSICEMNAMENKEIASSIFVTSVCKKIIKKSRKDD